MAKGDEAKTRQGIPREINVIVNDTHARLPSGALSPNPLLVAKGYTQPQKGEGRVECETLCTYTPPKNFSGEASFRYRATDGVFPAASSP